MLKRHTKNLMSPRGNPTCRSAFTIVELLIVIAIIMILLSIVVVAVNAAMRTAQSANTQALMNSINKGLVQFREDIGYLPPVLDENRDYLPPPVPPEGDANSSYLGRVQEWYSFTTLADYLLGYGDATADGYGRNNWFVADQSGVAPSATDGPLGIRHPGPDGYWGVAASVPGCASGPVGSLDARRSFLSEDCAQQNNRYLGGRSYGAYIELRDENLLAAIVGVTATGAPRLAFPGEAGYPEDTEDNPRKLVIVDYWGQPIRYYRKPYMRTMPHQEYRQGLGRRVPTLSDVFALRPYRPTEPIDVPDAPDASGIDTTTTLNLHSASFALMSSGPDQRLNLDYRVDPDEFNRDNIVEVGR